MSHVAHPIDEPLLLGHAGDRELTRQLLNPPGFTRRQWLLLFAVTGAGTLMLLAALLYTFTTGIGTWGNNIPVGWGFGIINFVWWIGIGHAGTFISAILLLFRQPWRTSINRFAEAMTLFAVLNAAIFPIAHLGRAWFFYWLVPYPSTMEVWPQFKSALTWDVAAISTYGLVSLLFWYLGLVPDLAAARDTATRTRTRRIYGIFALGWRGSAQHWRHYYASYGLLAALATPLVVSVHSVVSLDFASSKLPGWHSTIFPPYFVAGAIFSGFAMVLTLLLPVRRVFRFENVITLRHLDNMAKMILLTGSIVAYGYLTELFIAWYSGNLYERYVHLVNRPLGDYAWVWWLMITFNALLPQIFWSRRMRRNLWVLFGACVLINVGMWTERFVIIVTSLAGDFLPSAWAFFLPTWIDGAILFGTIFFFLFLFLLFLRFVPIIPVTEIKEMRFEHRQEAGH